MADPTDSPLVPPSRVRRQNISNSALSRKLEQIAIEKLANMSPRDIKIPRQRNRKGKILPEYLLSKGQLAYRRKRQLEIFNQLKHTQDAGRRGQ